MATISKVVVAIMCIAIVLSMSAPHAEGLTYGQVTSSLGQCMGYLTGGPLLPACCSGVRNLNGLAKTPAHRKQACTCLKSISGGMRNFKFNLAAGLPGKCGVNNPYKISPSADCSKVQ